MTAGETAGGASSGVPPPREEGVAMLETITIGMCLIIMVMLGLMECVGL